MISVERTREFDRVAALPRRALTNADAFAWAGALTPLLALRDGVSLRPWQAASLAEAVRCGGAWLALPVGQGKTLLSWLLPAALHAARTLLIVPASLVEKTHADFRSYADAWRAPPGVMRIESRERLAVANSADMLRAYAPDLIVIDEADGLANARSACARRVDRYVRSHDVRVVAMTGTPARKSIMAYWHLLAWTLGDGAPVPLVAEEARMWALALDEYRGPRPAPGPLGRTLSAARAWYRRRLVDTPGVVVVDEDSCDTPLTVRVVLAREDLALDAAFERFLTTFENPAGVPVSDPLSRWLLDGQLGLGLYTRWDPEPPEEWRAARRAIARFVRERIDASTFSGRPLDTEAQVLRRYANVDVVRQWRTIKPTFAGRTDTVWFTRSTLDACAAWSGECDEPAIVWTGCVEFGERLARETGLAYYGRRGQTADGAALHAAPTGRSLVASWCANKRGFNLQAWTRQLIVMPPASAKWLEQIFGRSHRAGQTRPVTVDVLATSGGTLDLIAAAQREAAHVRDTVALTQKLLRARVEWPAIARTPSNAFRWARKDREHE